MQLGCKNRTAQHIYNVVASGTKGLMAIREILTIAHKHLCATSFAQACRLNNTKLNRSIDSESIIHRNPNILRFRKGISERELNKYLEEEGFKQVRVRVKYIAE
jgi:hypothetical protein